MSIYFSNFRNFLMYSSVYSGGMKSMMFWHFTYKDLCNTLVKHYFILFSFSFLWGPVNHLKHLFSSERLVFTSVYFLSLFATLYFALSLQSTIFTSIAAIVQVVALLCFVLSNVPGGQTGLKFFSSICSSMVKTTVSKALPV